MPSMPLKTSAKALHVFPLLQQVPGRTHREVLKEPVEIPSGDHIASNYPSQLQLFHKLETESIYRKRRERPKIEGTALHEHQGMSPTALELTRADPARALEGTAPRLPQAGAQPRAGRRKGRTTAALSPSPAGDLRRAGTAVPSRPAPPSDATGLRRPRAAPRSRARQPRTAPAGPDSGQPPLPPARRCPPHRGAGASPPPPPTAVVYGSPAPSPPPAPCRLCPWLQLGWAAALIRAAEAPSCLLHGARSPHRDRRAPVHTQGGAGPARSYHGNRARLRHGRGRGGEGGRRGRRGGIIWDGSRAGPSRAERLLSSRVLEIIRSDEGKRKKYKTLPFV